MQYKNSFYNPKFQGSQQFITAASEPVMYKGYQIYQHHNGDYHIVLDGVCVGMRAGPNGACRRIDELIKAKEDINPNEGVSCEKV